MDQEIKVNFLICGNCDLVLPVGDVMRHDHDFETDEGDLLVVFDYHCPDCRTKLASWGTK